MPRSRMYCLLTRMSLPPLDRDIDVLRVELDSIADPADTFSREQRAAGPKEAVEHDVAAGRTIQNRICDQSNRLYRGVQSQEVVFTVLFAVRGVDAGLFPHVRAVPSEPAELNVIPVLRRAVAEHEHQLVAGPVEGAHAAV